MNARIAIAVALAAAATAAFAPPAHALSAPAIELAAGQAFGADGAPGGGGLSVAVTPLWPAGDRARFGVTLFADDIGTSLTPLLDPHNGTNLGTSASLHRWTWGAAWRGDLDVARRGPWTASASGTWGWWRIVDDSGGNFVAAASAVGIGLGGAVRHPLGVGHQVGLAVRWQRLFAEKNSAYRRMQGYASAALEWNWTRAPRP